MSSLFFCHDFFILVNLTFSKISSFSVFIDVEMIKKSHIRFLDSQPNAETHIDYDGIPSIIMGKKY